MFLGTHSDHQNDLGGPTGTGDVTGGLPFSAVVGLDEAKLALLLAAGEPRLGGVLLRGEKGSAKTTLARGLAALLPHGPERPGEAASGKQRPFVELPLGATEDRVIGAIDAAELLTSGEVRVRPGLMAAANGGVLYVDEINLLADHLVDALLDVAVSGINRIERDGVSHTHPARFVLIGSMNPEEGELRPQLLDRFGLAVDIAAPADSAERCLVVERQLALERGAADLAPFEAADGELQDRLAAASHAGVPSDVVELASRVALEVGAEGLRADLMLCRAAAALAGWEGRDEATADDLRRVAPMVLAHRRRRHPFDEPGMAPEELDDAFEQAQAPPDGDAETEAPEDDVAAPDHQREAPALRRPPRADRATAARGKGAVAPDQRGRFVRSTPAGEDVADLAVSATAIAVASRRAADPEAATSRDDLLRAVRETKTANLVIVAVDTSSSMGADRRIAAAKGAVLGLLTDAYQARDRVALIAFRGDAAEIVLRPTGSVEVARARLAELPTGGTTPLAHALDTTAELVAQMTRDRELVPIVVLLTDGRATFGGDDPYAEAKLAAARLAELGASTLVVDAEDGPARLGLARELAELLHADCIPLADVTAGDGALVTRIRGASRR